MTTASTPAATAAMAVSSFGIMPPMATPDVIRPCASDTVIWRIRFLFFVEHAGDVGQQQHALGIQLAGDGAGHGVGVDIEGVAFFRNADRRDHRHVVVVRIVD